MTEHFDYDLMVIGAGSGGVRAARKCAEFGAHVAVVEEAALGGTCVNVGCIPKKLYVYASEYAAAWREAQGFGWGAENITFDWATLRDNKTKEIARLNAIYQRLLETPGVDIIEGHGVLAGPQEVVGGESLCILITTALKSSKAESRSSNKHKHTRRYIFKNVSEITICNILQFVMIHFQDAAHLPVHFNSLGGERFCRPAKSGK